MQRGVFKPIPTGRPVQFEVSENTRKSVLEWVESPAMRGCEFLFASRFQAFQHLSTRQDARLVRGMGFGHRARLVGIWDTFLASHQGCLDLPQDQQFACGPALAWPYQGGQYCSRFCRKVFEFGWAGYIVVGGRVAQINLSAERALPKTEFMRCVRNSADQVRSSV